MRGGLVFEKKHIFISCLCLALVDPACAVLKDPTQPPGEPVPHLTAAGKPIEKPPLQLTAIIISGNQKTAIINGVAVDEGEMIEGNRVRRITPYDVTLTGKKGIILLRLFSRPVKGTFKKPINRYQGFNGSKGSFQ